MKSKRRPPPDAAATAQRALALFRGNAIQEAEQALREDLKWGHSGELSRTLGALYATQGRFDEAIDALQPALELEPSHADAANLMAVCHSLLQRYDEAAACYELALRANPRLTDVYANAGWNALLHGRADSSKLLREWLVRRAQLQPQYAIPPAHMRRRLSDVTLCCIDCAYHELSADALRRTLSKSEFAEALFFSNRDCNVEGVRFIEIPPNRSEADYSNFLMHRLHPFISTSHALVIQYDGFVLNADAWDPQFLEYDFIGPKMRTGDGYVVGNGGFSLRSKKLLEAAGSDEETRRYDANAGDGAEDIALCRRYRKLLESRYGIRFAPEAVADRFGAEHVAPAARHFGFHNLVHLVRLHGRGFALPQNSSEQIEIAFRAPSELGMLEFHRDMQLRSLGGFW